MKKAIKETPEQVAARNARQAELAKIRAEEKAQARAAEKAKNAAQLEAMKLCATTLSNMKAVVDTEEAGCEARLARYVGNGWLSAQWELEERSERLLNRPADYFEWAESDMKAAARREIFDHVVYAVVNPATAISVGQLVKNLYQDIEDRVLNNYDRPSSTSPAHNAMMIYKQDVRCSVLRDLKHRLEEWESAKAKSATANPFCAPMA